MSGWTFTPCVRPECQTTAGCKCHSDPRDAEIERLRAEVERLTKERDDALRHSAQCQSERDQKHVLQKATRDMLEIQRNRTAAAESSASLLADQVREAREALETEHESYRKLIERGKGTHGQPGYVRDDTWSAWSGAFTVLEKLRRAARASLASPPKGEGGANG